MGFQQMEDDRFNLLFMLPTAKRLLRGLNLHLTNHPFSKSNII